MSTCYLHTIFLIRSVFYCVSLWSPYHILIRSVFYCVSFNQPDAMLCYFSTFLRHASLLGYLDFMAFLPVGAGHNYRGDSAWVALLYRARFRFAKPRSAHIALQKKQIIFWSASGDGLREPKQQCTSGLALPLYQMRAPIIRAKKQKILDILSIRNSAPKEKNK